MAKRMMVERSRKLSHDPLTSRLIEAKIQDSEAFKDGELPPALHFPRTNSYTKPNWISPLQMRKEQSKGQMNKCVSTNNIQDHMASGMRSSKAASTGIGHNRRIKVGRLQF